MALIIKIRKEYLDTTNFFGLQNWGVISIVYVANLFSIFFLYSVINLWWSSLPGVAPAVFSRYLHRVCLGVPCPIN